MTKTAYRYQPIVAEEEIRVLRLEPGAFSDPLVARIFPRQIKIDLDTTNPDYDGISYCWGPFENFRFLECDGQRLRITAVVDEMLRHLRKLGSARNLWIDAICINQTDDAEKSKQVRFMGKIYATANKVHVWLGPATDKDDVQTVFSVFKAEALAMQNSTPINVDDPVPRGAISTSSLFAMSAFLSRAWFTRRWVLQEVALGHAVTIHCGGEKLAWDWFRRGTRAFNVACLDSRHFHIRDYLANDAVQALGNMVTLGAVRMEREDDSEREEHDAPREYESMLRLLWNHHTAKCADERDRLFSLYGMLPATRLVWDDPRSLTLCCPVDYHTHFVSTYTTFSKAAVEADLGPEILHHAIAFGNLSQQNETWPSWVPSWNMSRNILRSHFEMNKFIPPLSKDDPPRWSIVEIQGREALRLEGHSHRITETQRSHNYPCVTAYLNAISKLSPRIDRGKPCGYTAASILMHAINFAQHLHGDNKLDLDSALHFDLDIGRSFGAWSDLLWSALQDLFHLQRAGDSAMFDSSILLDQIDKILHDQEAFCYDLCGKTVLGVSSTQVEVGDYVFRPSVLDGVLSEPTRFALIIRPYRLPDYAAPRVFRLVGACVDSCIPFGIHSWYQTEPYGYRETYGNSDLDEERLLDFTLL